MGLPNLLVYALPFFMLSMYLEYRLNKDDAERRYEKKDFTTNVIIALVGVLLAMAVSSLFSGIFYYAFIYFEDIRYALLGYRSFGWSIYAWCIAIFLDDFTYYWFHRTSHRIRLLWACHIVHHNSEYFNFSTAVRNSWVAVFYKPLYWVWMAVIGFHPLMILTCIAASACYQFFCHTELLPAWDRLSGIFNTPGLHAIHHGKERHCIDKNYAGVFIFIDRLFGTYEPLNPKLKLTFGVTHPPRSQHFWEITIHEFRELFSMLAKVKSFSGKVGCLFNRPGWKPAGSKMEITKTRTLERPQKVKAAA